MAHNERLIRDICGMVEDIASTVRKENPKAERMMFGYSIDRECGSIYISYNIYDKDLNPVIENDIIVKELEQEE